MDNDKQKQILNKLVEALQIIEGIEAIALGGSVARGIAKADSDIDIGLYYHDTSPFSIDAVKVLAEQFNDTATVADFGGWGKWVNGGAWLTIEGQRVDFLYRSIDTLQAWITKSQAGEIELDYYQQPATGFYSYIYLGELSICKPLYQVNTVLDDLKEQVANYPIKLKEKIIKDFTWQAAFSLIHAEKAMARDDTFTFIGCLHRAASSIIQLAYAYNEQYFISDKGAVSECSQFSLIPQYFAEHIEDIFFKPDTGSIHYLREMIGYFSDRNYR